MWHLDHEGIRVDSCEGQRGCVWETVFGTFELWQASGIKHKAHTRSRGVANQPQETGRKSECWDKEGRGWRGAWLPCNVVSVQFI